MDFRATAVRRRTEHAGYAQRRLRLVVDGEGAPSNAVTQMADMVGRMSPEHRADLDAAFDVVVLHRASWCDGESGGVADRSIEAFLRLLMTLPADQLRELFSVFLAWPAQAAEEAFVSAMTLRELARREG